MLAHNIRWLKEDGEEDVTPEGVDGRSGRPTMNAARGRWIYSLLACLDPLVGAAVAALLRDLCRSSIAIKRHEAPDGSSIRSSSSRRRSSGAGAGAGNCNSDREGARVIATVIAAYFGQLDLLPEASQPAPNT